MQYRQWVSYSIIWLIITEYALFAARPQYCTITVLPAHVSSAAGAPTARAAQATTTTTATQLVVVVVPVAGRSRLAGRYHRHVGPYASTATKSLSCTMPHTYTISPSAITIGPKGAFTLRTTVDRQFHLTTTDKRCSSHQKVCALSGDANRRILPNPNPRPNPTLALLNPKSVRYDTMSMTTTVPSFKSFRSGAYTPTPRGGSMVSGALGKISRLCPPLPPPE